MTDSTDFKVYQIIRRCPSKGFTAVLAPDAPYGPEVVVDLRGRADAEGEYNAAASAEVKTDKEGQVDELSFMEVKCGAGVILMDLETASEICDALRFHEMSQRHEAQAAQ